MTNPGDPRFAIGRDPAPPLQLPPRAADPPEVDPDLDRVRRERDLALRLLDATDAMLVAIGAAGDVQLANRSACEVLGHAPGDLLGRDWFVVAVPPGERGDARHTFDRVLAVPDEHEERFESAVVTSDGRERLVAWHSTLLRAADGSPSGMLRSGRDVTAEREPGAGPLRAHHDALTGLAGRGLLEQHLALTLARARRDGTAIAVLCFDLDGFRAVNDELGRTAGDEVLREVARRMRDVTRANDLLARAGGDEFVLVLADLDEAPAESSSVVARVIRDSLAPPFHAGGADLHVSASIGISLFPDHADNVVDLLDRADLALQQAKRR